MLKWLCRALLECYHLAGDYIGSTVNVASRVTGTSSAGEILLTDAVAAALTDATTEPVGVRMLRGAGRHSQ